MRICHLLCSSKGRFLTKTNKSVMKTSILPIIFLLCLFIVAIGCSNDGADNNEDVEIDYGTMQAKVSGLMTIPDNTVLEFEPWAIKIIDNSISLVGETNYPYVGRLNFSFPSSIKEPGVYTESIGGSIMEGWSCSPNIVGGQNCWYQYLHNSTEGSVTITEINEEYIAGTFDFTCFSIYSSDNNVFISEGSFNILRE